MHQTSWPTIYEQQWPYLRYFKITTGNILFLLLLFLAFLKVRDCNVIVVDWSQIADHKDYIAVAKNVPRVASRVASFINFLRTSAGLRTSNMKIIGHSLGAHVAGLSAREVGKLSRVAEVIGK